MKTKINIYKAVLWFSLGWLGVFALILVNSQADDKALTDQLLNKQPVAAAGPDQTVDEEVTSTHLDGSYSLDLDNESISFAWAEISDSADGCSITDFTVSKPAVTLLNRSADYSCTFQLVVADRFVESQADEVTVFVTANNDAPTWSELADITAVTGSDIQFTIQAKDPEGWPLEFAASDTIPSGDYFSIQPTGAAEFWWQPELAEAGSYRLELSVSDGVSKVAQAIDLTIQPANVAPVFTGALPAITLTVSDSTPVLFDLDDYFVDANQDTLTYTVSGNTAQAINITAGAVTITAGDEPTTETVYVTATDPAGLTATSNAVTITTIPAAEPTAVDSISYVIGTNRGAGVVTVFDQQYTERNHWVAFEHGGVTPYLIADYVVALRHQRGRILKLFTADGTLLDELRLSPSLTWRIVEEVEMDEDDQTIELLLSAQKRRKLFLKVMQFSTTEPAWQIVLEKTSSNLNYETDLLFK